MSKANLLALRQHPARLTRAGVLHGGVQHEQRSDNPADYRDTAEKVRGHDADCAARAPGVPHAGVRAGWPARHCRSNRHGTEHGTGHVRLGTERPPGGPPRGGTIVPRLPSMRDQAPWWPRRPLSRHWTGARSTRGLTEGTTRTRAVCSGWVTVLATGRTEDGRLCREVLIETAMERHPTEQCVRTWCRDCSGWQKVATVRREDAATR